MPFKGFVENYANYNETYIVLIGRSTIDLIQMKEFENERRGPMTDTYHLWKDDLAKTVDRHTFLRALYDVLKMKGITVQ